MHNFIPAQKFEIEKRAPEVRELSMMRIHNQGLTNLYGVLYFIYIVLGPSKAQLDGFNGYKWM